MNAIETLKKMNFTYYFTNRMGPATVREVTPVKDVFKVTVTCNVYGHGSQTKYVYFKLVGEQLVRLTWEECKKLLTL